MINSGRKLSKKGNVIIVHYMAQLCIIFVYYKYKAEYNLIKDWNRNIMGEEKHLLKGEETHLSGVGIGS